VLPQIVAVHRHIKCANRNPDALHVIHYRREPIRQRHSPSRNSHQHQPLGTSVGFKDLVSDPSTRSGNLVSVHHDS
jgi:hypothetical protein